MIGIDVLWCPWRRRTGHYTVCVYSITQVRSCNIIRQALVLHHQ